MTTTTKEIDQAAKRAVEKIWDDLNDRSGVGLDCFDRDIQKEIRAKMKEIIVAEIDSLRGDSND